MKLRALRRVLTIALLLVGLGAGAWLERETLLRGLADLWIVSDPVTPADAIVVLGGGLEDRPFVAAELYQKGLAKKILVSRIEDKSRPVRIGAMLGHTQLNLKVLSIVGVPDAEIETFGIDNWSSEAEAVALREWAQRNTASVLIVPVEIFSTRRVRWIFNRVFHGTGIRIEVLSVDPEGINRADWWKTRQGLIAFQTEVLKYIYYRLKY